MLDRELSRQGLRIRTMLSDHDDNNQCSFRSNLSFRSRLPGLEVNPQLARPAMAERVGGGVLSIGVAEIVSDDGLSESEKTVMGR